MVWSLLMFALAAPPEIVGDWTVSAVEGEGLALALKENVTSVVIDAERITAGRAAEYTVDAAKKTIDMTIAGGPKAEQGKYLGFYELQGDGLKIHFALPGKKRPSGFDRTDGSFVLVLKKK